MALVLVTDYPPQPEFVTTGGGVYHRGDAECARKTALALYSIDAKSVLQMRMRPCQRCHPAPIEEHKEETG